MNKNFFGVLFSYTYVTVEYTKFDRIGANLSIFTVAPGVIPISERRRLIEPLNRIADITPDSFFFKLLKFIYQSFRHTNELTNF